MRKTSIFSAAIGLSVALTLSPALAGPGTATHIDSLSATVGTTIQVAGAATFVDVPANDLGTDPTNIGLPGADLRSVSISRPDPSKKNLTMKVGIGNMAPTDGSPLVLYYNWSILVTDAAGSSKEYLVQAVRAPGSGLPETAPVFRVLTCTAGAAGGECSESSRVTGTMDTSGITWTMPIANIGAATGSTISIGPDSLVSTLGAGVPAVGDVWFTNFGGDSMSHDEYVVPGPSVKLGIAPAGANPASVELTKAATVAANASAFTGSLTKPAPGSYIVVAEACYTGSDCVRSSTPVTVT